MYTIIRSTEGISSPLPSMRRGLYISHDSVGGNGKVVVDGIGVIIIVVIYQIDGD
jgi:hypothetical protein